MNQNPEQLARDVIDAALERSGWVIQNKKQFNLAAGVGVAIREYQTGAGPADSILFVHQKPVGLIEAKREEEGVQLTMHEEQSIDYTNWSFGANQSNINGTKLKTDPLFLLPLEEQQFVQEIESHLSVCEKIEETISDSLKQAEALRQSILKKAFEGNLLKYHSHQ